MAVRREGSEAKAIVRTVDTGSDPSGAVHVRGRRASVPAPQTGTTDEDMASVLSEISKDAAALNQKMLLAVRLLSIRGEWFETVRLLVGVGEYRPAEIADALGVMRSTVSRWSNGETVPQKSQTAIYFQRLLAYMQETRPFDPDVDPKHLIRR